MIYNLEIYFMLFIIYSVGGWIMECTLGVIQKHKFVNRGFLIGPYCPIYGCGGVLATLILSKYSEDLVVLFILGIVIFSILEYFTSYVLEKIFHARWWDYSNYRFNLNGRICLIGMLFFGILGVVVIRFVNPVLFGFLNNLNDKTFDILFIFLAELRFINGIIFLSLA